MKKKELKPLFVGDGFDMGRQMNKERIMRWMHSVTMLAAVLGLMRGLPGCTVPPLMHRGGIVVDSWAEVKVDNATVSGILASFNRARRLFRPASWTSS